MSAQARARMQKVLLVLIGLALVWWFVSSRGAVRTEEVVQPTARPTEVSMPSPTPTPAPTSIFDAPPEVIYILTGSARKVAVTLQNPLGGIEQFDTTLPYERPVSFGWDDYAQISGQILEDNGKYKGTLMCQIQVNGVPLSIASAGGKGKTASCSGRIMFGQH